MGRLSAIWNRWRGMLVCIALGLTAVNFWIYRDLNRFDNVATMCEEHRQYDLDEDLVIRSMRNNQARTGESIERMRNDTVPHIVELQNMTCVKLGIYGIGGEPVYCYDNVSKKLIYKHDRVE